MQWLVTGGCGFIGTNLVVDLLARGEQVSVVDNLSAAGVPTALAALGSHDENAGRGDGGPPLHVGDIRDPELAERACHGADVVVHLAACTGVMPSIEDPGQDFSCLFQVETLRRLHDILVYHPCCTCGIARQEEM